MYMYKSTQNSVLRILILIAISFCMCANIRIEEYRYNFNYIWSCFLRITRCKLYLPMCRHDTD